MSSFKAKPKLSDIAHGYQRQPTLAQYLPWRDYDDESGLFILEDGMSPAALFELTPIVCESFDSQAFAQLINCLKQLLQDTIPQDAKSPYHCQFFVQDECNLDESLTAINDLMAKNKQSSTISTNYLDIYQEHCAWLSQEHGVFTDNIVSGLRYQGRVRRIRLVLYRRLQAKFKIATAKKAFASFNTVVNSVVLQLNSAGIHYRRANAEDFYQWLFAWFNPGSAVIPSYPQDKPFGYDFVKQLFASVPESNHKDGVWLFNKQVHKVLTIESLSATPQPGHITAEIEHGNKRFALMDALPPGSVFVINIVFQHHAQVIEHLQGIYHSAVGDGAEAVFARKECQTAYGQIAQHHNLFPLVMAVYLRAESIESLAEQTTKLQSLLLTHGLKTIAGAAELAPLDAYLRYLPVCYDYQHDQRWAARSRYVYAEHIAKLLPVYGRYRGSGNPGLSFWNRGGEPVCFDPFNSQDKMFNSHLLVLGGTGAGKSATAVDMLLQVMAKYKPRLFIIEAGDSFGLLTRYFKQSGLSTHEVKLDPAKPTPLNPFADGLRVLQAAEADTGEEHRDILGEMALAALLMITGGEQKEQEKISRQDRQVVLEALLLAAKTVTESGAKQMLAEDIVKALYEIAKKILDKGETTKAARVTEIADSMAYFCTDQLSSAFFNTIGSPWPDVDVTHLDLDIMKGDGYEAQMGLAFIGIINRAMAIAEEEQYSKRMTLILVDESHIITQNPMTAAIVTKASKMSRKLGAWLWFLTQNLSDFPAESRKMLSMMEFWLCLGTSEDEIEQIRAFKTISDCEKRLLMSVKKSSGQYVEGVILSPKVKGLIRNIPPRFALALAMSEKEEKAERSRLMQQHNISEIKAASMIAEAMLDNNVESA